jgi:hypothetical protein
LQSYPLHFFLRMFCFLFRNSSLTSSNLCFQFGTLKLSLEFFLRFLIQTGNITQIIIATSTVAIYILIFTNSIQDSLIFGYQLLNLSPSPILSVVQFLGYGFHLFHCFQVCIFCFHHCSICSLGFFFHKVFSNQLT